VPVIVKLLPSVNVAPTALHVIEAGKDTLLVVMVLVPEMVIVPVLLQTVVADKVKLPAQFSDAVPLNVNDDPVVFKLAHKSVPDMVTVPVPEFSLNITVSKNNGGDSPPDPPEVNDQLLVDESFHVPDPPTQYKVLALTSNVRTIIPWAPG
jgi:hypothetical protein